MEITMKKMKVEDHTNSGDYEAYTISVDDHRIYTVVTGSDKIAGKWLTEALKVYNHRRHKNSGHRETIVVGFSVDKPLPRSRDEYPYGDDDTWYNLYTICIGAQCLVFSPSKRLYPKPPGLEVPVPEFNAFFADPRVVVVGFNMKEVVKKLDLDHGVKFRNKSSTVDVNEASARVLAGKSELNLKKCDLDELVTAVLGKHFYVVRPKGNNSRDIDRQDPPFLGNVHVKFSVVDAYFLYLLGNELVSSSNPPPASIANPSSYLSEKMKDSVKIKTKKKK